MDKLNFPLILVIGTGITGLIWLIDKLFLRAGRTGNEPLVIEYARSFFPVLFIVLFLRSFLFEPFKIPSGSMLPTLLIGDFILVSKFSYGVRLPVINKKIISTGSPLRGDVAVFRYPDNPRLDYIKRVAGLPGDEIEYRDRTLYINGEEITISGAEPYIPPGSDAELPGVVLRQEQLGDVTHDILVSDPGFTGRQSSWTVPEGHYFMVGDNRDRSSDSRSWGFVPEENLVGRAKFIWMHHQSGTVLWSRIGDKIQ
ncbi:MAG: signal peptidase I [Granulosicoccus sp.]|nr:signal peptidase I [Granulosicoccus sp.]